MEKYRKFIEKAYNGELGLTMCKDWKAKIEEEFPETFKPCSVGDWVWLDIDPFGGCSSLMYFQGWYVKTYGFNTFGNWEPCFDISRYSNMKGKATKATDKEVKDALIAEANKRGFKKGVTIIPVGYDNPQKISDPFYYISNHRVIASSPRSEWSKNCPNPEIYRNGVWASIVEQQTELTLEQIAEKFNISVGDLRIKGVSSETTKPFCVGDVVVVKDSNNDLYGTQLVVKAVLRRLKTIAVGSWSSDTILSYFYEHQLKHAN